MTQYERQPWAEHLEMMRPRRSHAGDLGWHQGQHIMVIAPTGGGKTTLASPLLDIRSHVVMLANKTQDPTLVKDYVRNGWTRIRSWSERESWMNRVLLWPSTKAATLRERAKVQAPTFREALNGVDRDGGWCLYADETHYLTAPEFCGLSPEIALLHHQGRSSGISVVTSFQRPAWVPRIVYSSATHAYITRTRDRDDLRKLAELGGVDPAELAANVRALPSRFDFVYVNPQGDHPPVIVNTRQ